VLHFARGVEQSLCGYWLISEKSLRAAVGETSRQRTAVDVARWRRLSELQIVVNGQVYAAPSVTERAITVGGEMHWSIEPALVDAFRVYEQTNTVYVPLRLLRGAKHRTTIVLALRALAWRAGTAPPAAVLEHDDGLLSARLSEQQLRQAFGLEDVQRDGLMRHYLEPAIEELDQLDVGVSVAVKPRTAFRAVPAGRRPRVMGYDVTARWDEGELAAREKAVRISNRAWRRNDVSRKRRPPAPLPLLDQPADGNVVQFKRLRRFAELRRLSGADD
jgi:hypothetical protein